MAGDLTLQQITQTPFILKVISRIKTPLSLFQQFFGMLPGQGATRTVSGRYVGWDIMDVSRQMAKGRAPGTGPSTVTRKSIGHVSGVVYRTFEKVPLYYEDIFRARPLGSQIGTVDARGQDYIRRQMAYLTRRSRNSREFMISRMLRGGFSLSKNGDDYTPIEYQGSGAVVDIDYQIPATHKTQLDLGTGSNVITASWATASTDVISHVLNINKAFERIHGWPMRHIWINSTTFGYLMNNTKLQAAGGTAYRIFETFSSREIRSEEGMPDSGFDVVFRALPLWKFHVYDGVLAASTANEGTVDETTVANTSLLIPDNVAIFMPDPDPEWCGLIEGSEFIMENILDAGREVYGFHSWMTRDIDPPRLDLKSLDNAIPALFNPKCIAYGTVIF